MNVKLIVFIFILFYTVLNAQQNEVGPHKGKLKRSYDYQIELIGCTNYVEIYLFDKDTQAISNSSVIGNVIFIYDEGKAALIGKLARYGMDGFTVQVPSNSFLYCKPSFNLNGVIVATKFENECLSASKD